MVYHFSSAEFTFNPERENPIQSALTSGLGQERWAVTRAGTISHSLRAPRMSGLLLRASCKISARATAPEETDSARAGATAPKRRMHSHRAALRFFMRFTAAHGRLFLIKRRQRVSGNMTVRRD